MTSLSELTIASVTDTIVTPNTVVDWGMLGIVIAAVIASMGQAVKKVIEWGAAKITAPDSRLEELEAESNRRHKLDLERLAKLEDDMELLRAEIFKLHDELTRSEVARAITEGELKALRRHLDESA